MAHESTVQFFGGTGSVTGSNFLLDTGSEKILIDCGLFQGERSNEVRNWEPFPFDPKNITALVVTHAHIDHIGRIPKLVKEGFRGQIISTQATKLLAGPMLQDALELTSHTAHTIGKEPLWAEGDTELAMSLWQGTGYHEKQRIGSMELEFFNSGHILGSALAKFSRDGRSIIFSGDVGGGNSPLLPLAEAPTGAQYLLIESVYGDRKRDDDSHHRDRLENMIEDALARGGPLLIPAFSTERTQDLLFEIRELMTQKRVPSVPVYLDSPLAERITQAYMHCPEYFADDVRKRAEAGEQLFSFPELTFVENAEESRKLALDQSPKIVLAGSGMSSGGRAIGHERILLPNEKATVLIVGYQAAGSLGRRLVEGAKQVEIYGPDHKREKVTVRASIQTMYGYSAHMDGEQLLDYVSRINELPEGGKALEDIFVVMGEPASSSFLAQRIRDYLGLRAFVPTPGESAKIAL